MPSAEETTAGNLMEMMPDAADRAQEGFGSRDVDALVSRIKENLRLSSCLKSRSSLAARHASLRSSPYKLPSRSWSDQATSCEQCLALKQQQQQAQQQDTAMDEMATKAQAMCCHHQQHYRRCRKAALQAELDDSYELFAALLRKGALIKEAVKRLQTYDGDDDVSDGELIHDDVFVQNGPTRLPDSPALRRKRFYYEDEDEPLPL